MKELRINADDYSDCDQAAKALLNACSTYTCTIDCAKLEANVSVVLRMDDQMADVKAIS